MLNSFNHYRAIAIILIVMGHSIHAAGAHLEVETLPSKSLLNIMYGGTSLFVFISGFLFHHVFYRKYQYKNFLVKKIINVMVPYLLLSFGPVYFMVIGIGSHEPYFIPAKSGIIHEYILPAAKYYISGTSLTGYWYIPFIMVIFALSPFHVKYITLSLRLQLLIIGILSVVSILIHRPVSNINVLQSVIYFTPVYLIGITASANKDTIYEYLKGRELYLLVVVVSLAILQAKSDHIGSYHKRPFDYGGVDLMYCQKIAMCFFMMVWLYRFESYNNKIVHSIAAMSFCVYFIHPFILWFYIKWGFDFSNINPVIVTVLLTITIFIISITIGKLVRAICPKYSRFIIGY